MSEFDVLDSAAAGMDADRTALDVAARNVAVAETADGNDGFERVLPRVSSGPSAASRDAVDRPAARNDARKAPEKANPAANYASGGRERGVPVDAITEMVAVLDAQRAYERNAAVFDVGKRLAERTIAMGSLS